MKSVYSKKIFWKCQSTYGHPGGPPSGLCEPGLTVLVDDTDGPGLLKDFRTSAEYFQPELRNSFQPPKMEFILRLFRTCRDKKKQFLKLKVFILSTVNAQKRI